MKLLKDFCVAALREAGLREYADWLDNAPKQAVNKVAKIVVRALGLKGSVDEKTASEIKEIMKTSQSLASRASVTDEEDSDDSNLAQYLLILNHVITAGSSRPYLLLDGFLHTPDCTSLWKFDTTRKEIELDISHIFLDERSVHLYNSGVEIFLLEKIDQKKLIDLNAEFGRNPNSIPKDLDTQDKPKVRHVYENKIETVTIRLVQVRQGKRGAHTKEEEDFHVVTISSDHDGVEHLLASLQPALKARAQSAQVLKKFTKDIGGIKRP